MSGVLVALDGPGGAGKSSMTRQLFDALTGAGLPVLATTEPSRTELGELARHGTDTYRGLAYACLIAADRYHHLDSEITPALQAGRLVLCDRYIASSLVLQRLDGVPLEFLRHLAAHVPPPDMQIILTADPGLLRQRLDERGTHSRYERDLSSCRREHELYAETARLLREDGVYLLHVDTSTVSPAELTAELAVQITALWQRR
ncbi:dTMP kinase [Sphaerisporangium flaviroseum]|uniref:Thymidylate kinase n=1 Tax=Sphaerisporangium flaviroseum TaxID=509199 RepID=A0ABP7I4Q7_9ACTN